MRRVRAFGAVVTLACAIAPLGGQLPAARAGTQTSQPTACAVDATLPGVYNLSCTFAPDTATGTLSVTAVGGAVTATVQCTVGGAGPLSTASAASVSYTHSGSCELIMSGYIQGPADGFVGAAAN